MVWCGIHDRKLLGPYFFDQPINGAVYLQFLKTRLWNVLEEMPLNLRNSLWFQHDGAPPHYAAAVRNWLNETFQNRWVGRGGSVNWPARSPDLSSCDFFLWGHLKGIVFQTPVENLNNLRRRITNACTEITQEMLKNTEAAFIRRLEKCIYNNGGHVEGVSIEGNVQ
ncbi:hypothetical protein WN55_04312 [Dufourea novaeangliae]|uniref:Transposable element Tc3 transposase n=1 Tax=Dufourea novaeangliae TaxID=178035 RepID=A0A154PKV9_DUFNO|nr:hypothetical protein WN55_04312 [Dufourea novaeangliae]